jgi:hypothetical protein
MNFELLETDALMWPGKYGLVGQSGDSKMFALPDWEAVVERSEQLVPVPSGRREERPTYFFASSCNRGRVELVYHHGYVWPVNPPPSGREIMEELVDYLNGTSEGA